MKLTIPFITALLLAGGVGHAAGRDRIRFDAGWRFHRGDVAGSVASGGKVIGWRWKQVARGDQTAEPPKPDASWKEAADGEDTFHGRRGYNWYAAELPKVPGGKHTLHFDGVDDNATVWVNGKRLIHHEGWNEPFDVPLDSVWRADGPNEVIVLVQNTDGAGNIAGAIVQAGNLDEARGPALPGYDDSGWRTVHVPHDYIVEGVFDRRANTSHGSLPTVVGWYRKNFTLPTADRGRRIWLDFDGIYRNARVWLNGKFLGRHPSGYIGYHLDITNNVRYGTKNVLAVLVDPRAQEGWWYEGGGIYRHVWLTKLDPVHIARNGVFVTSEVRPSGEANVTIRTTVVNQSSSPQTAHVWAVVHGPGSSAVERSVAREAQAGIELAPNSQKVVVQTVHVAAPKLWSVEQPNLYQLSTILGTSGGKLRDTVATTFGIRTFRFDPDHGFFLNGKHVELKGTCNHQDFAGVGIGMPDSLLEWRIKKLKEMGSNSYRMSHNPPAPELLDACDRLGMIVMDENRHLGDTYADHSPPGTGYSDLSDLKEMILRDRNHPSLVMWSMCNEEGLQGSEEGARIFKAMKDAVLALDKTRPITCAMNGGWGRGISNVQDLQGCNYSPGGYDTFHRAHPNMPMYGSETASAVSTRGIYANDPQRGYVSAYDVNAPPWAQPAEVAWKAIAERPYMAGCFVWTGFDYKGEPTPYGWPCINSHFGIMDECGFPKDTWWYYKAWWGDRPIVHILPHWNWPGKEGKDVEVWVHGNTPTVELLQDGRSLGVKEMPLNGHLVWKVPYQPGRLEARGFRADVLIAKDVVETTGPPAKLQLKVDRTALTADGEDVAMVEVAVLDAQGRIVPTADSEVSFAASGALSVAGVGNGDPSSHEPDRATKRHAFNGRCMVIVQAGNAAGPATLFATVRGLEPATLSFSVRLPAVKDQ